MADTKYLEALIDAIKFVYERSDGYFKTTEGRERSMVFRIAHHLAHNIENKEVFVDIEPTRCERKTKRDSEGNPIIPDLIIHKRIDTGYVAVEFKCSRRYWKNDFNKLKCLTTPEEQRENDNSSTPHYEIGVFVYLTNEIKNIEINIFTDGCENTELTDQYQNKFKEK